MGENMYIYVSVHEYKCVSICVCMCVHACRYMLCVMKSCNCVIVVCQALTSGPHWLLLFREPLSWQTARLLSAFLGFNWFERRFKNLLEEMPTQAAL